MAVLREDLELSVVMPCLNEAKTVGVCVEKALGAMREHGVCGEVVVSDNGSTDQSVEIAESHGARVVHCEKRGYGNALMAGIEAAHGRYVIMGDADDSYDFSKLGPFVEGLREGYDLVMGSRFRGGIMPGAMPWKNRYLGNPMLTRILNLFFRAGVSDVYCGLRGFTKDLYDRLHMRCPGMEFALEMVVKASKLKVRVTEVPIVLHPDGRGRPPHLRPLQDGWRSLKFLLMFSPTYLFLVPGLVFLVAGLVLMGSQLLAAPGEFLWVFGRHMSFHWSILGSLLTLLAYQVINVHFFARIYSVTHRFQEPDRFLTWSFRALTLERVLLVGVLVALLGAALDGRVLVSWIGTGYGPLVPGHTRLAVLGSTLIGLGVQTVSNAFFYSILGDGYTHTGSGVGES